MWSDVLGMLSTLTQQWNVVGGLGDVVGDVQQEDAEAEQHDDTDLYLLCGRAEEDGEEEDGGEDAGQDDIERVIGVATLQVDPEGDVREALVRTALVEELVTLSTKGMLLRSAVSSPLDRSNRFTLHSLADMFIPTPTRLLWEAF